MRYSKLFGKTRRDVPRDVESINGQLLHRAGFVDAVGAGIYTWLPLGLIVLRRVQNIVREEMEAMGCQEVLMPALHPKEYWECTGRWNTVDVLFKTTSQTGKEYGLGASHEEIVTPLAGKFIQSYRDLPFAVYQIQTKFRDELRAKGGVLRGREFGMKDAYSFHTSMEDLQEFYDRMLTTYRRVYDRCGVETVRVRASGGMFTENVSDEFHVETSSGEDTLLRCAACKIGFNLEIAPAGNVCPACGGPLVETRGIEVGNTFNLGTKYADACGLAFLDQNGNRSPVIMGCYGIGTTRLVGAIVEARHDDQGIIWPDSVAPYRIHILAIPGKNEEENQQVFAQAESVTGLLERQGLSVLHDDRDDVRAGEKFADADLIGIPWRVVVSARAIAAGGVEIRARNAAESTIVPPEKLLQAIGGTDTL